VCSRQLSRSRRPFLVILRAVFCLCHPEEPKATKDLGLPLRTNIRSFADAQDDTHTVQDDTRRCHPEEPQATKDPGLPLKTNNRSFADVQDDRVRSFTAFRTTGSGPSLRSG